MLLRRYGSTVQSVDLDFDPRSLNEVSFRRNRELSLSEEEFSGRYEKAREEVLGGEADGPVQSEAEAELLRDLASRVEALMAQLEEGEVLVVENEQGVDYPKVRDRKQGIIVNGENRLYFHWRVDPPLRLGIYRRRA